MGNLIKDFWTYDYKGKQYFGIVEVIKGNDLSQKRNVAKYETHIEKALNYTMENKVTSHISIQTFSTWLKDKANRKDNEQRYYPFILEFEPKSGNSYADAVYEAASYVQYLYSELGINKEDILIIINNNKSIYVEVNPKAYDLRPDMQLNRIYFEMYKNIKHDLNFKNVDESIVTSSYKVMKAPNSFYKGGYCVRITIEELMKLLTGSITKESLTRRRRSLDINVPGEMSLRAVRLYKNAQKKVKSGKFDKGLEDRSMKCGGNCVQYLLTHMVEKGSRNYSLVSVAIYLKSLGYSKEETFKNLVELSESWEHDENNRQIKSKVETIYRRNYRFSCTYAKGVFEELGIENICSKCPFANKGKLQLKQKTFDIDPGIINKLWANKASTRHYLLYLKLVSEELFNININFEDKGINIRTLKELSKLAGLGLSKVEGVSNIINIKYIPSKKVYRLPTEFMEKTVYEIGDSLKQYLRLFVKGYKAVEKYILIRASKENLMSELGYKNISSLYKLLNKLKNVGLIKVHNNNNYTLYYKSFKVIEIQAVEEQQQEVKKLGQAVGQESDINNLLESNRNYKGEQQKFNIDQNNLNSSDGSYIYNKVKSNTFNSNNIIDKKENSIDIYKWNGNGNFTKDKRNISEDIKLRNFLAKNKHVSEKYKRLHPALNLTTGEYYFKYAPIDLDDWIDECRKMNLSKEMVIYNTKKYGYLDKIFYVLQRVFD